MDCSEAKPELERYASDRMTPAERLPIEEHVSMCEECSLEVELIRNRGAAPAEAPDDWTVEKIFGAGEAGAAGRTESAEPVEGVVQGPYAGSSDADHDADETPAPGMEPPAAAPAIEPLSAAPAIESHTAPSAIEPHAAPSSIEPDAGISRAVESEARASRAVEPPAPPAAPAAIERPSMILPLPTAEADAAPAATGRGAAKRPARESRAKADGKPGAEGWDFEPAGAKVAQTPPEGTVQLAETALVRGKERSGAKSAATRALLWGVGGLAGVVLLGASVWLAMTRHEDPAPPTVSRPYGGGVKARAIEPVPPGIAAADSDSTSVDALAPPEGASHPLATSNAAPVAPIPLGSVPPSAAP
ncbi:MAG TPA: hypothetical protein VLT84_00590, partial [Acidobacteriota bacterium]|nr:hypothetical protein [Acidobacteriota bacterium]